MNTDTLLEPGRVSRPPLQVWAAALVQTLTTLDVSPKSWGQVGGSLNNASLIEVFRGQRHRAWDLCETQLRWAERLVGEHGPLAAGDLVLQPSINEGRLLRIQGDGVEARERFSLLAQVLDGRPVQVGRVTFDAATFKALVDARSLWDFLRWIYVVDSTKTYMAAGDCGSAASFLREAEARMGGAEVAPLDEMELVVLAKLGRYREALDVTERASWQASAFSKMVRVTYRTAMLSALGAGEAARRLAEQLAERVLQSKLSAPNDQRVLRYLHYLGELATHLTLDSIAVRAFQLGLSGARHLVDVPLELSFLESLLRLAPAAEREALAAERGALLRACLYVTLLKPRGVVVDPIAAADGVFDELRRRLEEITGADTAPHRIHAHAA